MSNTITIAITPIEAQSYAEGLAKLCDIWYAGKKHDQHLLQKHLSKYDAVRELIGKLNDAIRDSGAPAPAVNSSFDLDMARENEGEASLL
jgi:hypothetical protein